MINRNKIGCYDGFWIGMMLLFFFEAGKYKKIYDVLNKIMTQKIQLITFSLAKPKNKEKPNPFY